MSVEIVDFQKELSDFVDKLWLTYGNKNTNEARKDISNQVSVLLQEKNVRFDSIECSERNNPSDVVELDCLVLQLYAKSLTNSSGNPRESTFVFGEEEKAHRVIEKFVHANAQFPEDENKA